MNQQTTIHGAASVKFAPLNITRFEMKSNFLLLPFLLIVGCSHFDEQLLVGNWQASFVSEDGKVMEIDYTPVNFEFSKDGFYTFNSTIDYKEAGSYYINGNLLYTTDTLNTATTEKAVEITCLTQDSLILKMMANEKPKMMKLFRVN